MGSLTTFLVANEEIWSVGSMALQVGEQLEEQLGGWGPARTKRKAAVNKVSQDTGPGQPCEILFLPAPLRCWKDFLVTQ